MIDLEPKYLDMVKRILHEYMPDCEVGAFGSRVNGRTCRYSDLDLVLKGKEKIDWRLIEKLKNAFSASDLPIIVDVLDWQTASASFRKVIQKQYEIIQPQMGKEPGKRQL